MAGVAGPMLAFDRRGGMRFLLGLWLGELTATVLAASVVFALGEAALWAVPATVLRVGAGLAVVLLGVVDMANRTPHTARQVPQALVRSLAPGRLGLTWGFDLALLVTTQKSTSLLWSALVGLVLVAPTASWFVLAVTASIAVAVIAIRSVTWQRVTPNILGDRSRPWFPVMRRTVGAAQVALGVAVVLGAVTL
jgi:hypothetical protein